MRETILLFVIHTLYCQLLNNHSLPFLSPSLQRVSHPPKQTMEFLCILLLCHISLVIFSIDIFHWDHRLLISYDWFFPNEQSSLFIIQTDVSVHGIRELAFSYTHQGCCSILFTFKLAHQISGRPSSYSVSSMRSSSSILWFIRFQDFRIHYRLFHILYSFILFNHRKVILEVLLVSDYRRKPINTKYQNI